MRNMAGDIEFQRTHGKTREAHQASAWAAQVDLSQVMEYSGLEATAWLFTLRTHVDTGMTMYSQEPDAVRAAGHLSAVREPIIQYYLNGDVFAIAQKVKKDGNNEHQAAPEICRDLARYYLRLTELFGMPSLLTTAIDTFDLAIAYADAGSSARGLAGMEKQIASKPFGPIDMTSFTRSYETTKRVNMREGNWNRLAVASWWHARESMRALHLGQAMASLRTMLFAEKKDGQPPGIDIAKDWGRMVMARRRKMSFDSERIRLQELILPLSMGY